MRLLARGSEVRGKLNRSGFGLIETMVAVGLVGIIALGAATTVSWLFKSNNTNRLKIELENLNEEIRALLAKSAACTNTMNRNGTQMNLAASPIPPIPAIRDFTLPFGNDIYLADSTTRYGDRTLVITRLTMTKDPTLPPDIFTLTLFYQTAIEATGSQNFARTIQISTVRDASNRLTSCVALSKGNDSLWQRQTTNPMNIYYDAGYVGVGLAVPQVSLDVQGGVRPGNEANVTLCNGAVEGTTRYNRSAKRMEFCDGAVWKPMGGLTTRVYYRSVGGFSWTVPNGVTRIRVEVAGGGGGGSGEGPGWLAKGGAGGNSFFAGVTAGGGLGGSNGSAPGGAWGGDSNLPGKGAYGGTGVDYDGGWGGLGIRDVQVSPGQVLSGVVGGGGFGGYLPGYYWTGQVGQPGWVMIEY